MHNLNLDLKPLAALLAGEVAKWAVKQDWNKAFRVSWEDAGHGIRKNDTLAVVFYSVELDSYQGWLEQTNMRTRDNMTRDEASRWLNRVCSGGEVVEDVRG